MLFLILTVTTYVRLRLLQVPLERDEGEYAYIGQLLLKGVEPFTHAYSLKLPGVSALYALFMLLFGQTSLGIHLGLLVVNSACILLVFLLARRMFDQKEALVSCASYAILSLSESVLGVFSHATHFVVLFALAGFLLLLRALEYQKIPLFFFSGVCFGLSFLMKQNAFLLIVFAFLYYAWCGFRFERSKRFFAVGGVVLVAGTLAPYLLLLQYIVRSGVFAPFWFWTVQYALAYTSILTPSESLDNFIRMVLRMHPFYPILLLAGVGAVNCWKSRDMGKYAPFALGLLFFSFLAVCPGFYFRPHYVVLLLPAVSILAGHGSFSVGQWFNEMLGLKGITQFPFFLLAAAAVFGFYCEQDYSFWLTPSQICRKNYYAEPFDQALQIADYLRSHTKPADRIAVLGCEPEIYFYADRMSATGHIYIFGMMENQPYARQMEAQMIQEIESVKPKYIVVDDAIVSYLQRYIPTSIMFNWKNRYLGEHYELAGAVDIRELYTLYYWDSNVMKFAPGNETIRIVTVFKQKDL